MTAIIGACDQSHMKKGVAGQDGAGPAGRETRRAETPSRLHAAGCSEGSPGERNRTGGYTSTTGSRDAGTRNRGAIGVFGRGEWQLASGMVGCRPPRGEGSARGSGRFHWEMRRFDRAMRVCVARCRASRAVPFPVSRLQRVRQESQPSKTMSTGAMHDALDPV
jgi:hypothetical protein